MSAYRVRENPLKGATDWALEDGDLVRRSGRTQARWPLAGLTRMSLARHVSRYGADIRFVQLRFGRRAAGFTSQGWQGVGRPLDQTRDFSAFVRALAAEAAARAPGARFELGGPASLSGGLWWIAGLLGAAIVAMAAMALSAGMARMGLDLAARLLFLLILLFAVAPWLPGRRPRTFDPLAPPADMVPRPPGDLDGGPRHGDLKGERSRP